MDWDIDRDLRPRLQGRTAWLDILLDFHRNPPERVTGHAHQYRHVPGPPKPQRLLVGVTRLIRERLVRYHPGSPGPHFRGKAPKGGARRRTAAHAGARRRTSTLADARQRTAAQAGPHKDRHPCVEGGPACVDAVGAASTQRRGASGSVEGGLVCVDAASTQRRGGSGCVDAVGAASMLRRGGPGPRLSAVETGRPPSAQRAAPRLPPSTGAERGSLVHMQMEDLLYMGPRGFLRKYPEGLHAWTDQLMRALDLAGLWPVVPELLVYDLERGLATRIDLAAVELATGRIVFVEYKTGYAGGRFMSAAARQSWRSPLLAAALPACTPYTMALVQNMLGARMAAALMRLPAEVYGEAIAHVDETGVHVVPVQREVSTVLAPALWGSLAPRRRGGGAALPSLPLA